MSRGSFSYDTDYVNSRYNSYGELGPRMAYLRLGHLVGSLGLIPESIMDIGYGNGDFLKACKNIIKSCYGSDVSGYPLPANINFIQDPFSIEVDVITFYDVLEHFDDIYVIKNLKCKYVVISVPECHYNSDNWFNEWKHRRPDEHLWHFNKISLKNFMLEIGFELINYTNIEDVIRKPGNDQTNILTGVLKKIK